MDLLNPLDEQRLKTYMAKAEERANNFLGYPIARDFDYSALYPLFALPLNNIGDPMVESTYDLNSRSLEQEVLSFFCRLIPCAGKKLVGIYHQWWL